MPDANMWDGVAAGRDGATYLRELERTHDELRAALILAGKRLGELKRIKADDELLAKLRAVLRQARAARKQPPKQAVD